MTDLDYLDRAEDLLRSVEATCDHINEHTDADIDNQRTGGMVTLTFANRSQIIINLQKPLHEVWMAAQAGGFHYRYQDGRWLDTKDGSDFHERLSACATQQAGQRLQWLP